MKYAIVYSSKTGNTKRLAQEIRSTLAPEDCVYFGEPDDRALEADVLFVGFWTDKGDCDERIQAFLQKVDARKVFLFGTAGFGGAASYFDAILHRVEGHLPGAAQLIGTYMCQGKMPMSVRERYERMLAGPNPMPNLPGMIENFDRALTHPDADDLSKLKEAVRKAL